MPHKVMVIYRWQVVVAFLAVTVSAVIGLGLVKHVQNKLCNRVDRVDSSIVTALKRSRKSLPTNAYFKEHPDELKKNLKDIRDSIKDFQGNVC